MKVSENPPAVYKKYSGWLFTDALQDIFNSEKNAYGEDAIVFLGSSNFREGISLKKVKRVYVAGPEGSKAGLVQAVARAIRMCSHKGMHWESGKGWEIEVYLAKVMWHSSLAKKIGKTVRDVLNDLNPGGAKFARSMTEMAKLIAKSAVDHALFKDISRGGANAIPFEET
jgi:hypothetical protein